MSYAKLINNQIEYAPQNNGAIANYNLNTEMLLSDGYKPLIECEIPINDRNYEIVYTENNDNIVQSINYLETQEEYETRKNNEEKQLQLDFLNSRIQEIDLKRIRAVCEPSIKDENTGQTWLDYYNAQIQDLRQQILNLQGENNDITD